MLSVFHNCSLPYFLRQGLPLNLELTDSDKMPASSRDFLPLPSTGITGKSHHSWLYEVCSEDQTQLFTINWQACWRWSHLPSPTEAILKVRQ